MTTAKKTGRTFLFRIPPKADLCEALEKFLARKKIRLGTVSAIGALSQATIGYYDQEKRKYFKKTIKGELEIVACIGNVSLKDGKPFPHLHAALSDTKMRLLGGHLFPGSTVFVAEVQVQEIKGKPYARRLDSATGLPLWPIR
ncbi:MAG: PPC domain-containing DNA-binding protein [Elusimicrobiota bacterium]